jgi:hypothetical protein
VLRHRKGGAFEIRKMALKSDDSGGHTQIPNTLLAKIVASYQARSKRIGVKAVKSEV